MVDEPLTWSLVDVTGPSPTEGRIAGRLTLVPTRPWTNDERDALDKARAQRPLALFVLVPAVSYAALVNLHERDSAALDAARAHVARSRPNADPDPFAVVEALFAEGRKAGRAELLAEIKEEADKASARSKARRQAADATRAEAASYDRQADAWATSCEVLTELLSQKGGGQ